MKQQFSDLFVQVPIVFGVTWTSRISSTIAIANPATELDCFNECYNIRGDSCQLYVFGSGGNCYVGNFNVINGIVPNPPTDVTTVYVNSSNQS